MTYQEALAKLTEYGQQHVLAYFDSLTDEEKAYLLAQIDRTDLSVLTGEDASSDDRAIEPLGAMTLDIIGERRAQFEAKGIETLRAGKAAAVLLAGGMGTRLGFDKPKGMYNMGITKPLYIFECLIRNMLDVVRQADAWFHLCIMTSEINDADTRAFLAEHDYFGYKAEFVHFFVQDTAAATDYDKRIYMLSKSSMAVSPNGNGGWFSSMTRCGLAAELRGYGVEWLNIFAVDNVLQRICDPVFLGATVESGCPCGAKVVSKASPDERVGVMCRRSGAPSIVEYYEMTDEMRDTLDENGERVYNFGVILNYLFSLDALEEIGSKTMPLHIVEKKIPYMNESGELVKPDAPNGYKYENLILDMIELMGDCLPFEVVREREFAPVKNATGVDSVESARALLEKNGVIL